MNNILFTIGMLAIAVVAYSIFFALPVMYLWNYCLVGAIDGIHEINFVRALGICILVALLTFKAESPKQTQE